MNNIIRIDEVVKNVRSAAISGHIRPDGDCIGACVGMYLYLKENHPQIERLCVYLEEIPERMKGMKGTEEICHDYSEDFQYDLFISLDCSDHDRLGEAVKYFDSAAHTICYDHHISNPGYAEMNCIYPNMSSASELVYDAMDTDKISLETAELLYMGIAHDTGIFQYSNTSPETMITVADLMRKGVRHTGILETTYLEKTYLQNLLFARAMMDCRTAFDGACMISGFEKSTLDSYHAKPSDLDGIVSMLRQMPDVEVSVLIHEMEEKEYKVSLRSKSYVDVNKVANVFGGGGHVRAAGCSLEGTFDEVIKAVTEEIQKQIRPGKAD